MAKPKNDQEPLRGDAAWKARKAEIAKNNDSAQRRGREQRSAADAVVQARRADAERREFADLPVQPEP